MSFALIEVEATAKKAARGAGHSWGMAEEAARATRWLCAHGIDGVAGLARALARVDGSDPRQHAPVRLAGDWSARAGAMCPLMAGAALADSAAGWAETGKRIENVAVPVMLLPFAAMAARHLGAAVTLEWNGARAITDGQATSLEAAGNDDLLQTAAQVRVLVGGTPGSRLAQHSRAVPDARDWETLNRLAHRTYAPDTEASRLRGAGAGLSDND